MDLFCGFNPARIGQFQFSLRDTDTDLTRTFIFGDNFYNYTNESGSGTTTVTGELNLMHLDPSENGFADFTDYRSLTGILNTIVPISFGYAGWTFAFNAWPLDDDDDNGQSFYYDINGPSEFELTVPGNPSGDRALQILGFSSEPGLSGVGAEMVSNVRPFYCMRTAIEHAYGLTNYTDEYVPRSIAFDAEADSGRAYSIARSGKPLYIDFEIPLEPPEATFPRLAANTVRPWTWEDLFMHCENYEPIMMFDSRYPTGDIEPFIFRIRAEGANFRPNRKIANYNAYWDIPFVTRLVMRRDIPEPVGP